MAGQREGEERGNGQLVKKGRGAGEEREPGSSSRASQEVRPERLTRARSSSIFQLTSAIWAAAGAAAAAILVRTRRARHSALARTAAPASPAPQPTSRAAIATWLPAPAVKRLAPAVAPSSQSRRVSPGSEPAVVAGTPLRCRK